MFGIDFYNETTRRYVAVFGTLFNDIKISRKDNTGTTIQTMAVPINYGPMQKFLAKLEQDPGLRSPAITLPRITFEIMGMTYDGERNLGGLSRHRKTIGTNNDSYNSQFTPTPYNLEFQLNIMTKFEEDGSKILEQILPFFKPEFTPTVKLIDELDMFFDIPVILNSVSKEDTYEGSFEERRSLIWTLSFTMKAYYFGPVTTKKVIKFANVNVHAAMDATTPLEVVRVRPGLTANGEPTTNLANSVTTSEINFDDDWAYIAYIEDYIA
jgi:hypothetical protein